ncbi:hypothetical protein ACLOJK_021703 [Asimina triloba]
MNGGDETGCSETVDSDGGCRPGHPSRSQFGRKGLNGMSSRIVAILYLDSISLQQNTRFFRSLNSNRTMDDSDSPDQPSSDTSAETKDRSIPLRP